MQTPTDTAFHGVSFQYHAAIIDRYPLVCGGVILAQEILNRPTPEALQAAYLAEQRAVLDRIGQTPLSELEHLAAWRQAFRSFGVDPTKYRCAAEALLRRLTKKGDIPCINALVDICNLVSIRYALPVAAFDAHAIQGAITVRFAGGAEIFIPHDQEEAEHPEAGEVIFSDEASQVVARRWCWKQSRDSAASLDTRSAILTLEAQHAGSRADVEAALGELLRLLQEYVGGDFKTGVLSVERPSISA
jgi:DNA/RNA-binding domain of Phe-tRNA-synthetase-like protein